MKKYFLSLGLMVAAAFTLTNCTQEIDTPVDSAKVPFEIVASTVDTKTVNDGMTTEWTDGDALNVFHAVANTTTYVNNNSFKYVGENVFKGELEEAPIAGESYDWYVRYPYSSYVTTPGEQDAGYTVIGSTATAKQNQVGNNSMAHIAGVNYPLVGVLKNSVYNSNSPVSLQMNHLASLIELVVTNESDEPLTVENISFTATEDIVGQYYINFTDGENPEYTPRGENNVSSVASVIVNDAEPIAVGETATFYFAVKPFTAPADETLSLLINDYESDRKLTADLTFAAGKIKTINCSYKTPVDILNGISEIKTAATAAGVAGGTFVADVENAVVTYVNGNNAYMEDANAGILVYAQNHGLNIGDVLTGRISGSVKVYRGLREITAFTSNATVTHTDELPLTTLTIAELNTNKDKYENMRIQLLGVEVTANASSGTLTKDDASIAYYKKNNAVVGLDTYNIVDAIGYPGLYDETYQFNIWYTPTLKGASVTTFSGFSTTLSVAVDETVANVALPSSGAAVTYVSANTAVATVDEDGNVTGVAVGETTVTASVAAYNGYPAAEIQCAVTVTQVSSTETAIINVETVNNSKEMGNGSYGDYKDQDVSVVVDNIPCVANNICANSKDGSIMVAAKQFIQIKKNGYIYNSGSSIKSIKIWTHPDKDQNNFIYVGTEANPASLATNVQTSTESISIKDNNDQVVTKELKVYEVDLGQNNYFKLKPGSGALWVYKIEVEYTR